MTHIDRLIHMPLRSGRLLHNSITVERAMKLAQEHLAGTTNPGICTECGTLAKHGIEIDAIDEICIACGEEAVCGPMELLDVI